MTILKAENISKQYRLGTVGTGTIKHDFNRFWHRIRGKENPYLKIGGVNDRSSKATEEYVWALRDINFDVREGEVLGIIGKNGAGKSTLLKILSRVTSPTTGVIKTRGRIASLLEVGTGFHSELTGRENIYLNGAILGMTKTEIASKIEEIIEFSGCQLYIDTPVKRYSSGMTVRLGFAVAAHLEPEILVVDEVLAVGDAEFQKKAIGKMQDISKSDGRTILFVSHNMAAVRSLCTRAIILENGGVIFDGDTEQAVDYYLADQANTLSLSRKWDRDSEDMPNSEYACLLQANVLSDNNYCISTITEINFVFELFKNTEGFNLSLVLLSVDQTVIFNSISPVINIAKGLHSTSFIIPKNFLNNKTYAIRIILVKSGNIILDVPNVLSWEAKELVTRDVNWFGEITGQIRPEFKWEIK